MNINEKTPRRWPLKFCLLIFAAFFLLRGSHLCAEFYRTVFGEVIDEETGKPIEGVKVSLAHLDVFATTGKNGKFYIYEVPPGPEKIAFFPPSPYAYERVDTFTQSIMIERGKNLQIIKKMKYGGVLEMEIFALPSQSPLEGVFINIEEAPFSLQLKHSESYSDSNGKFRLDRLAAGKYTVILRVDGYGMKILTGVEIQAKQTTVLKVPFDSTNLARLVGRVLCKDTGTPLKDVLVGVHRLDQYGWSHTYTGEDGRYYLFDLEPGMYKLFIKALKEENGEKKEITIIKKTLITKVYPSTINFTVDCALEYKRKEKE
jgi:5-hydroxyisourate hydrolase-like protein (transthyretin family)